MKMRKVEEELPEEYVGSRKSFCTLIAAGQPAEKKSGGAARGLTEDHVTQTGWSFNKTLGLGAEKKRETEATDSEKRSSSTEGSTLIGP